MSAEDRVPCNYDKYKLRVKRWEKDFRLRNGRIPSKHDIRESSIEVRYAYKMYYQLKTSLLEDTLQDVLDDDDDFDSSLVSQVESTLSQSGSFSGSFSNLADLKTANISISNPLTDQAQGKVTEFVAEQELEQNSKAWGSELNRKKPVIERAPDNALVKPKLKAPAKLMEAATSLPKRNPRKSLSSRLSSSCLSSSFGLSTSVNSSWKESLPDLETLLNEKSKQSQETSPTLAQNRNQLPKQPVNQVDQGWLNRQTGISETAVATSSNNSDTPRPAKFGLRNINLPPERPAGAVEATTSFGMSALSMNSFSETTNSKRESMESVVTAKNTAYDASVQSDSDGVVENSEDESLNSSTFRHVAKKRKVFTSVNSKVAKTPPAVVKEDLPEEKKPVEVENRDPAAIDEESGEPKPKRGRKAAANPRAARKATATKVPAVRRNLTRGRKPVSYKAAHSSGDEAERDPYEDFDDDDKDPDFKEQ